MSSHLRRVGDGFLGLLVSVAVVGLVIGGFGALARGLGWVMGLWGRDLTAWQALLLFLVWLVVCAYYVGGFGDDEE